MEESENSTISIFDQRNTASNERRLGHPAPILEWSSDSPDPKQPGKMISHFCSTLLSGAMSQHHIGAPTPEPFYTRMSLPYNPDNPASYAKGGGSIPPTHMKNVIDVSKMLYALNPVYNESVLGRISAIDFCAGVFTVIYQHYRIQSPTCGGENPLSNSSRGGCRSVLYT